MNETIHSRLDVCNNLPSLPGAAMRIVELARDPQASMAQVADAVKMDPALAAKVLRMANSPLYARRRCCESFQQALVLLGLNATLTLALTFSLVSSLGSGSGRGLDYTMVWQRALLAATVARVLAKHFDLRSPEELFLAGLLQDIGMLALDRAYPELYDNLTKEERDHDTIKDLEFAHLGEDHAAVGAWLLKRWNLPETLQLAVEHSHQFDKRAADSDQDRFNQVIALSGSIADLWLSNSPEHCLSELQSLSAHVKGLDGETLVQLLYEIAQAAPEIESLFDMALLDPKRSEWILHEAREVIVFRNLQMVQESAQLREVAASLQAQAQALQEKSRRDNLTGAFNRGHLDKVLADWFADSNKDGIPITLLFVDLDNFKKVNDVYGHHIGDQVLVKSAQLLDKLARGSDLVARYGGEEFVLLLPGCSAEGARKVCNRLLRMFRETRHSVDNGEQIRVSVSLGVGTHGERWKFNSCDHLLRSADEALYQAKQTGRDRFVEFELSADAA